MAVYVLDRRGKPLMPCSEKRARKLLEAGRARVHRVQPFVIRLIDRTQEDSVLQPLRLKIDPGSKASGLALVRQNDCVDSETGEITEQTNILSLMEIIHRGLSIKLNLEARRNMRRRRRKQLRYRPARFYNRAKPKEWLAPSLVHRVMAVVNWVKRIQRWAPIAALSCESVRFDMQKLQNPEIDGVEYQQGTLFGYEVREYLLEKWKQSCAYCKAADVPLEIDHIQPKSKGGSDRVSNLVIACRNCNQKKSNQTLEQFLCDKPDVLKRVLSQVKIPLRDAAAVNSTRNTLMKKLEKFEMPLELASGGQTKYNRSRLKITKTHALDAVCVGNVHFVQGVNQPTLQITCTGRGKYQRTLLNRFGFPRGYFMRQKQVQGFQTGDLVQANVLTGKNKGKYCGRVTIRKTGSFNIKTATETIQGIHYRYFKLLQRGDGYSYK